jgi:hypothetical protein
MTTRNERQPTDVKSTCDEVTAVHCRREEGARGGLDKEKRRRREREEREREKEATPKKKGVKKNKLSHATALCTSATLN